MWSRHIPVCRWVSNRLPLGLRSVSTTSQQRFHSILGNEGDSKRSYSEDRSYQKWKLAAVGTVTVAGKAFLDNFQ